MFITIKVVLLYNINKQVIRDKISGYIIFMANKIIQSFLYSTLLLPKIEMVLQKLLSMLKLV